MVCSNAVQVERVFVLLSLPEYFLYELRALTLRATLSVMETGLPLPPSV